MSDHDSFLMVVPAGWTEILNFEQLPAYYDSIQQHISDGAFYELNIIFDQQGILPPNTQIINARAFRDTAMLLWVQYAPDP